MLLHSYWLEQRRLLHTDAVHFTAEGMAWFRTSILNALARAT